LVINAHKNSLSDGAHSQEVTPPNNDMEFPSTFSSLSLTDKTILRLKITDAKGKMIEEINKTLLASIIQYF
jgi:hypothetical protein